MNKENENKNNKVETLSKDNLKTELGKDLDLTRGAMREMLEGNRKLTQDILQEMTQEDVNGDKNYNHIEEFMLASKNIIDAAKVMQDVNGNMIKAIKEIDKLNDKNKKIDLNEMLGD